MTKLLSLDFYHKKSFNEYRSNNHEYLLCDSQFHTFARKYYGLRPSQLAEIRIDVHDRHSPYRVPIYVLAQYRSPFFSFLLTYFGFDTKYKGKSISKEVFMYTCWHDFVELHWKKSPEDFKIVKEEWINETVKLTSYMKTYYVELYY